MKTKGIDGIMYNVRYRMDGRSYMHMHIFIYKNTNTNLYIWGVYKFIHIYIILCGIYIMLIKIKRN